MLTCSSLFGFYFLNLFRAGVIAPARLGIRRRGVYLILAVVSFGLSFGSGWLLSYLLSHACGSRQLDLPTDDN